MGRFPVPARAVGWFQVGYGDELAAGEVRPVRYFGRELVLWRVASGRAALADAYCPHLGTHLGHGGTVDGERLRCPMHGMCYEPDGTWAGWPHDAVPPRPLALRTYPVVELNSLLLAWYDPDGAPPGWEVPPAEEIETGAMVPIARHRWQVRTIWQEVAENLVDLTHVGTLHGLEAYRSHEMTVDGPHRRMAMEQPLRTAFGSVAVQMHMDHHGPGYGITRIGDALVWLSAFTPIDDELLDVRFAFFARDLGSPRRTRRIGAFLADDFVRQTEQHIPIWEHKAYIADPPLTPVDGPITEFRRWAEQFYVR